MGVVLAGQKKRVGWLLASSVAVTIACYQFRWVGFLGPGELGLLVSVGLLLPEMGKTGRLNVFTIFWVIFLSCSLAGAGCALARGVLFEGVGRCLVTGALAMGVTSVFSTAFEVLGAGEMERATRVCLGMVCLTLLVYALLPFPNGSKWVPSLGFYYFGLGTNPNQLAAFCTPVPFLALQAGLGRMGLVTAVSAAILACFSGSSAAMLALACGVVVAVGGACLFRNGALSRKTTLLAGAVILLAYGGGCLLRWVMRAGTAIESAAGTTGRGIGVELSERLKLWANGIEAGCTSLWTGLGMGYHSGFEEPFNGVSAHSSFIDVFTMGGILAFAAFTGLFLYIFIRLARAGLYLLLGALSALAVIMLFGSVFVQPYIWFVLVYLYYNTLSTLQEGSAALPGVSRG